MSDFMNVEAAYVTDQPGDATMYAFLLAPLTNAVLITGVPGRGADMGTVVVAFDDLALFGQVYGEKLDVDYDDYNTVVREILRKEPGEAHPITELIHDVVAETGCNVFTAICALKNAAAWIQEVA